MKFFSNIFNKKEIKSIQGQDFQLPSVFFLNYNGGNYDLVETKLPKTLPDLIENEPTISNVLNSVATTMFYANLQIKKHDNESPDKEILEYQKYLTPILYPKSYIYPQNFQDIFIDYLKRTWQYGIWGFIIKEDLSGNYIETILPTSVNLNSSYNYYDAFYETQINLNATKMDFKKVNDDWFYSDGKQNYYLYVINNIDIKTFTSQSPIFALGKSLMILAAVTQFVRDYNIQSFRPAGIISITRKFPVSGNKMDISDIEIKKDLERTKKDLLELAKNGATMNFSSSYHQIEFLQTQQNIDINGLVEKMKFFTAQVAYAVGSSKSVILDLQDYSNNTAIKQNQVFDNEVDILNRFLKRLDTQFLHKYLKRKISNPAIAASIQFENLENETWINQYYIHADLRRNPEYRKKMINDVLNITKGGAMGTQDATAIISDAMEDIFGRKLKLPTVNDFTITSKQGTTNSGTNQDRGGIRKAKDSSQVAERVLDRANTVQEELENQ